MKPPAFPPASVSPNVPEFSVSEISGAIKAAIEDRFGRIRVRGEIGRVFRARSGHFYYDLKDERNVLACTTWKGQAAYLGVIPEEGIEVIATGVLSAFGPQSRYTLNVDAMEMAGVGALMAMLEQRKARLAGEGLFDPARKKPLPFLPEVIGVITSPAGAVLRDILHRLRDRFPRKVVVWPVTVQGKGCAPEVARALAGFDALPPEGPIPKPDVVIVARGGGSLEDLWGFNEESVVRAAAGARIPVIAAVGHETDTTLIDHAADRRAPTPTAAAEMAVPVRHELASALRGFAVRLETGLQGGLRTRRQRLVDVSRGLPRQQALLALHWQRFDLGTSRLPAVVLRAIGVHRLRLGRMEGRLGADAIRVRLHGERRRLNALGARLHDAPRQRVRRAHADLDRMAGLLNVPAACARIVPERQRALAAMGARVRQSATARLGVLRQQLSASARLLQSLGYKATLERGYAVVWGDDAVVTNTRAARTARTLAIEFADGRLVANLARAASMRTVKAGAPSPKAGKAAGNKATDKTTGGGDHGDQGTLL